MSAELHYFTFCRRFMVRGPTPPQPCSSTCIRAIFEVPYCEASPGGQLALHLLHGHGRRLLEGLRRQGRVEAACTGRSRASIVEKQLLL